MYPIPFIKTLILIDETVYQYRLGTSGQSVAVKSQQKNRQMLARVTTDLAKYMKELKLDGVYQEMMYSRISGMLHSTVKAYHSIRSNKNIYEEWKLMPEEVGMTILNIINLPKKILIPYLDIRPLQPLKDEKKGIEKLQYV